MIAAYGYEIRFTMADDQQPRCTSRPVVAWASSGYPLIAGSRTLAIPDTFPTIDGRPVDSWQLVAASSEEEW